MGKKLLCASLYEIKDEVETFNEEKSERGGKNL